MVTGGGEEVARFYASIGSDTSGLARGAAIARAELVGLGASASTAGVRASSALSSIGASVGLGLGVAGAALASRAFSDAVAGVISYETAFTGVRRTVEGTEEEMAALDAAIRTLAMESLPVGRDALAEIATIGGQMGLATRDIPNFIDTVVRTSVSTNGLIGTDEAALALGRLAGPGLLNLPIDQLDELASAILKVGDESKANEREVVDFALRLAGAGRLVGLTRAEIIGLAAELPSLGINAELGGTAISQTLLKIQEAVSVGGEDLTTLARISGTSSSEFARMWRDDAGGAFALFLQGVKSAGKDIAPVFDELGFGGARATDTLLRLSQDTDGWRAQTAFANAELLSGQKIIEDSGAAFGTTANQVQLMRNNVRELSDELGGPLVGALNAVLPHMITFVQQTKTLLDGEQATGPMGAAITTAVPAAGLLSGFAGLRNLFSTDSLDPAGAERLRTALSGNRSRWPSDDESMSGGRGPTYIVEGDVNVGLRPDGTVDLNAAISVADRVDYTSVGRQVR